MDFGNFMGLGSAGMAFADKNTGGGGAGKNKGSNGSGAAGKGKGGAGPLKKKFSLVDELEASIGASRSGY
jgi:hypothetical protein